MLLTPLIPSLGAFVMGGCYAIPNVQTDIVGVFTNKAPTDAIRGAGSPEATHMIEVTLEQLAAELGIDPVELRRKNFIPKDSFPAEVATGVVYDSGDYEKTLDRLLEHVDMGAFRSEQEALRSEGIYRGIGFSTYTEICGLASSRITGPGGVGVQAGGWESALVRVHNTGTVTAYTGARATARATRPRSPRSSPTGSASTRDRGGGSRRHRRRARGSKHLRLALAGGRGRGAGEGREQDRR